MREALQEASLLQAAGWVAGAGGHGLVPVQTWASHIETDPSMSAVDRRELEVKKAADRYADADPKSIYGSTQERLRALLRVVGLAARGLSI